MKRAISLLLAFLMVFSIVPLPEASADTEPVFVLPTSLQEVEEQAFMGNTGISKLVIPNSVTSIGKEAFADCTGLTEVSISGTEVSIDKDAFLNCSKDVIFYAHEGSSAMLWALEHGYRCVSLDDDSEYLTRFLELVSYSGFDPNLLLSSTFASKCLIVRTPDDLNHLPDISAYHPIDIFRSDEHLYYIQFATEDDTEVCFSFLHGNSDISVEPDRIGAADDVYAQGVTIAENWGTGDTMGFDVYAPYVAEHSSGSVTIAVIDSGVGTGVWGGIMSGFAASFVDFNVFNDSARHGSKVVSIINDCLGSNKGKVTLLPIKAVNSSSMYRTSVIIESIKYAANHGANIINLCLGWDISEGTSPEIERQIKAANEKGILVVAAAGNGNGSVMYPASCDGVIAVSALTYSVESGYSVRSRTGSAIDYTAPGMYLATSAYNPVDPAGDIIGTASTSFAAPQITAALALIQMDSTHVGSAPIILDSCCLDLGPEGLSSSAYGRGLPQLDKLARIEVKDIRLKNMDGGTIPSRLWLADKGNDFMLTWDIVPANVSDKTITIASSKPSVASYRQYGNTSALITAKNVGETVISVTCGSVTKDISLVVEKPVTEILLTGTNGTLYVSKEVDLAAAVLPENANNRNVTWRSSNETVATVTQTGHVKALASGTVTITCEAMDGYGTKGQIEITVLDIPDATAISLTAKEKEIENNAVTLEVGETLTLIASIQPEEALQECRFSVFPQGIVTVSEDGVVKALESGAGKTATIVATATTGNNIYTGLTVSVIVSPVSVSIKADKTTLDVGETTTFTAEVLPDTTTDKSVTWASKNTAVATVNSKTGLVKAVASGSAEITCTTVNGKKDSVTVTVRQPITITLDPNGGSCDKSRIDAYSGYPIGALPTPTREYYTFNGWYTAKSGGTKVTETTEFTEATTIYAHWTPMQYTMKFDANGGSVSPTQKTCYVDTPVGDLPTPKRDSYAFKGWYTEKSSGTKIDSNFTHPNTAPITVYARWEADPYTITLKPNGGSCWPTSIPGIVDEPVTLPTPTREYYTWKGWYTAASDGEQVASPSALTYVQGDAHNPTFYAQWDPKPYTMTFDANGGTCSEKTRTCYVDTDIGDVPTPSKPYYRFEGWYTTDGKIHVTSTYQQATTTAITVRAKWTPQTYTITLNPNEGNCSTPSIPNVEVDKAVTLPIPTRNYYTWKGWYTAASGGKQVASPSSLTYVQADTSSPTFYAQWTPNKYTMTFDANGGSVSPTSLDFDVDIPISGLPTPKWQYREFQGWFTAKSGGTKIADGYVQKNDSNITVYAHWKAGTYTITLNENYNGGATTTITGTVDVAVTLPTPTRNCYTFNGWYTKGTDGTEVANPYTQNDLTNQTFYARWKPQQYAMKFDANGGTLVNSNDSIKYFDVDTPIDVSKLPKATRSRYTFNGWYTETTGGTKIDSTFTKHDLTTITVYAHWDPIYVTGITIVTNPSTTSYIAGDKFNASGLTIKATYNDGTVENHSASDCTFSSPDMKTTGKKSVTVSYGGKSATFSITVNALTISLSVNNTPDGSSGYINLSASVPRGTVSWASNNSNVATVDSSGKVTFKKTVGTAKITATVNNNGVTNSASKTITVSNNQGTKFGETSSSTTGTVLYGSRPDGYSTELPVATGSIPSYTTNSADVSNSSTNTSNGRIEVKYTNNGVDGYVYYQFNYNSSTGGDNIYKIINFEPTYRRCYINDGSTPNYAFYESFGRQFYSATNYPEARAEQNWTQYTAYWWAYRDKQAGHTWYTAKSIGTGLAASWYRFPLTKYTKTTTTYTYYCFSVS